MEVDQAEQEAPGAPNSPVSAMALTVGLASLAMAAPFGALGIIAWFVIVVITTLAVLAIAAPAFVALRSLGFANGWTAAAAGFLTGGLSSGLLFGAPARETGDWTTITAFGLGGAASGVFFLMLVIWPTASRGRRARFLASTALLTLLAYALYFTTLDPWREQPPSFTSTAMLELHVTAADWPVLHSEIAGFARERGWPIRADVRTSPEFLWFQAELGPETGTHISLDRHSIDDGSISIAAFQPQGGDGWRVPFRALQNRLEARWPGKVSEDTPQPPWGRPSPKPSRPAPSSAAR
jgi:hypothetical protein